MTDETPNVPEAAENQAPTPPAPAPKKNRGPRKAATRSPEMARVSLATPYKVHIPVQNITVRLHESPKVELDSFVRAQLKAGVLKLED